MPFPVQKCIEFTAMFEWTLISRASSEEIGKGNLPPKHLSNEILNELCQHMYSFLVWLKSNLPKTSVFVQMYFTKKSFLSQWKIVPESIWIQHYMYSYLANWLIFIPTHKFNFCYLYTLILIHRNVNNFRYVPPIVPQGRPMNISIGFDNFEILKVSKN